MKSTQRRKRNRTHHPQEPVWRGIKDADVVPATEAGLDGYCDTAYRIKPEFHKYFPSDDYGEFDE